MRIASADGFMPDGSLAENGLWVAVPLHPHSMSRGARASPHRALGTTHPGTMHNLHIWPHRTPTGWRGPVDDDEAEFFEAVDLVTALEQPYDTHAHFCCYRVPDGEGGYEDIAPRTNKPGAAYLTDQGTEPVMVAVAIDIDTDDHTPWGKGGRIKGVGKKPKKAVKKLAAMYPQAIVYATRGGARLVWALSRPVPVSHGDALVKWAMGLVPWADTAAGGWNRCYALPRVRRDGVDIDLPMNLDALRTGETLDPPPLVDLEAVELKTRSHTASLDGDWPADPLDEQDLDDLWAFIYVSTKAGKARTKLLAGEPIAPHGKRNKTLHSVVNSLGMQLAQANARLLSKGADVFAQWVAVSIFQMIRASVDAAVAAGSSNDLDVAWSMATRIAEVEAGNADQAYPDVLGAVEDAKDSDAADQPPIVTDKTGKAVFVCDIEGHWRGPYGRDVLAMACKRYRPDLVTASPKDVPHSFSRICRDYATDAKAVVYTFDGRSGFDEATETLYISTVAPPRIPAVHQPQVARWLECLFGRHTERALRWLASLPRTDWPLCALYIEGPKQIGKGLLAASIAKTWGSTPVPFSDAMARFNGSLARCPLVFLDEDGGRLGRRESGIFRSLVTEGSRSVEIKYSPPLELRGYLRVLIAANNPDALTLTSGHTKADVDAIVERLWHHKTDASAAEYLEALGGAEYTRDTGWLEDSEGAPGLVPQHLAWLAATTEVIPDGRLLVEGSDPTYHRRVIGKDEANAEVLYAIAAALLTKGPGGATGVGARARPGVQDGQVVVWVNPSKLHGKWNSLISEDQPKPTLAKVARTVRGISDADSSTVLRLGKRLTRAWPIDPYLVADKAEEYGLDGLNELRVMLDLPPLDDVAPDEPAQDVGNRAPVAK